MIARLADEYAVSPVDWIIARRLKRMLSSALADLPRRHLDVLTRRFGLDGAPPRSRADCAAIFGNSVSSIRAVEMGALSALPQEAPLMLEHLKTAEEYAEGAAYIKKTGAEAGLQFA